MIIELQSIDKTYINQPSAIKREVLKQVSLQIKKGDKMAIVGPSGSGKTTLLNMLGLLDLPTSGIIKFNEKEVNDYSSDQLAAIRNREIGFVFQSHHLLPQLNLLENVLLPTIPIKDKKYKKEAAERALVLLEKVGLADKAHQYPSQLSGGECQRTALIRALINQPKLILADEPTGSLDEKASENIGALLASIQEEQNVALVVVTHSLSLAETIGNIHYLNSGKLSTK